MKSPSPREDRRERNEAKTREKERHIHTYNTHIHIHIREMVDATCVLCVLWERVAAVVVTVFHLFVLSLDGSSVPIMFVHPFVHSFVRSFDAALNLCSPSSQHGSFSLAFVLGAHTHHIQELTRT